MWNIPNYRRNVNLVWVEKTKMMNFQYPIVNLKYVPCRNFVLIRQDLYTHIIYRQIGVVTMVTKRYRTRRVPKICEKSMLLNGSVCPFQIKPILLFL